MFTNRPSGRPPAPIKFLFMGLFFLLFVGVVGLVVQWLWNHILVDVTQVKAISIWQAYGILILARILFGGFHFNKPGRHIKNKARRSMRDKWMQLSDEEKTEMKERWRDYCRKQ